MAVMRPFPIVTIADPVEAYSYLEQTPMCWLTSATQLNQENTTAIDGRYVEARGELHGTAAGGGNRQDTFIQGTAARTGFDFTVKAGNWNSNVYHSEYHCYGVELADGGVATSEAELLGASAYEKIPSCEIIVRRGQPPVTPPGTPDTTHKSDSNYAYITLGHQSHTSLSVRIELVYGKPIRVCASYDGTTYKPVNSPRDLGNLERYLIGNDREMRIKVSSDPDYNTLTLEFGDGDHVTFTPSKSLIKTGNFSNETATNLLPGYGKFRFQVKNGTFRAFILPSRFQPIVVERLVDRNMGEAQIDNSEAVLLHNHLTKTPDDQTLDAAITSDGQKFKYKATVSRPDAGDGLGSKEPPIATDFALIIPPKWSDDSIHWGTQLNTEALRTQSVDVLEVSDDISQTVYSSGAVTVNNYRGYYNGSYGHVALRVDAQAETGGPFGRLFTGYGGAGSGVEFTRFDPSHLMSLHLQDKSLSMQVGLNDEHVFDGWYLFAAVRWLAQLGGIHPRYLQSIPELKYGPAQPGDYVDNDMSGLYYQLPRGYGINPRFRYPIGISTWSILQDLVLKLSYPDPTTGLPLRWYMGFDPYGSFHFEPISFVDKTPVALYSDRNLDGTGKYMACGPIKVSNTIENMRTSLDFMGIDALTYELLYVHLPMPDYVKHAIGFRIPWQEHHASYASQEYIESIVKAASIQAGLPTQRVQFPVPFIPGVHAGDVIGCDFQKSGIYGYYKVDEMTHHIAMSQGGDRIESTSMISAKALVNTL